MPTLVSYAAPLLGVILAAYLRGLSGFGFALAAVPLLGVTLPPRETIPLVTALQFLSCLPALGRDRADADWPLVTTLSISALFGLVPGIALLRLIDNGTARLLVSVLVLACLTLLSIFKPRPRAPKFRMIASVGVVAGLMQGLAGMAGPPVILLLMASPHKAATIRASLIAFFLLVSAAAFLGNVAAGLVTAHTIELTALSMPSLFVGQYFGRRTFDVLPETAYRRVSSTLLYVIAGTAVLVSVLAALHP